MKITISEKGDVSVEGAALLDDGLVKCFDSREGLTCCASCPKFKGILQYQGPYERFKGKAGLHLCGLWLLLSDGDSFIDRRKSR